MGTRPRRSLFAQLSLAFGAVSVATLVFFGVVMVAVSDVEVSAIGAHQEKATTTAVATALEATYQSSGGWLGADLRSVFALAAATGSRVTVKDATGVTLGSGGAEVPPSGHGVTVAVVAGDRTVGSALVRFKHSGLLPAEGDLPARLLAAAAVIALIAAAISVAAAVLVARRISRPLRAVTGAVHAMERGDREARVGGLRAPSELVALAAGFDQMADTVAREDQFREALVADVAHELRTPIAVLQATAESVLDGVSEPSMEVVRSMHEEVLRVARRVADLQALASAQTASLSLKRGPLDLDELARSAVAALGPRFAAAGLTVRVDSEPTPLAGDRDRLYQVVTNLLTNAAKFTPAGGTVTVKVSRHPATATLAVTDTGIGIPAGEQPHLFERFWRGHAATGSEGSGIGLAIAGELAAAHGGTIQVRSSEGEGSTFELTLPAGGLVRRPPVSRPPAGPP